jgi:prephenate dehydrogenase
VSTLADVGAIRVVGTGLLGTSVALGLRATGARVLLADPSPGALSLAAAIGAGEVAGDPEADLVLVAVPPAVTAQVVLAELAARPGATVTDVASVKAGVVAAVRAGGGDLSRFVPGHPMAGRERSGPVAARGDLFEGRPWVLCPTPQTTPDRVAAVRRLALALGAVPVEMAAERHDEAVAVVSHLPQIAASLVAARLRGVDDDTVALAGGGLRDVTRIAASDPQLWQQILAANAAVLLPHLRGLQADLDRVVSAAADLAGGGAAGAAPLRRLIEAGNAGQQRIPGKHGGTPTRYEVLSVVIPDEPGALARLFSEVGGAGVNVEELALEHAPGRAVGLLALSVLPGARPALEGVLRASGWHFSG